MVGCAVVIDKEVAIVAFSRVVLLGDYGAVDQRMETTITADTLRREQRMLPLRSGYTLFISG